MKRWHVWIEGYIATGDRGRLPTMESISQNPLGKPA